MKELFHCQIIVNNMTKKRNVKLAIIDSHALIHRAYHALPPMTTRHGEPTNAVFGFTTMLLKMWQTLKPTHVVAAFDLPGPTFRHKEFAEYKAHRAPADDELISQFDLVRQVVDAFNIPILAKPGFEADDIIGTLVTTLKDGIKKVVITGDMDTLQLIDDDTSIFTPKRGIADPVLYDENLVNARYGFGPEFITDYKGLSGDPSDNIPGVVGIGKKTAGDLIHKYGSIESIYEHLDELPKRAQTRLRGHKKDALFSRKLATIKRDVALKFNISQATLNDFDPNEVRKLFEKLEFRSLIQKIPKSLRGEIQATLLQGSELKLNSNVKQDANKELNVHLPVNYHIAVTPAEQKNLRERLAKEVLISFDTETDQLGARQFPIVGMSFAIHKKSKQQVKTEAWYVPINSKTLLAWKGLLENPKIKKIGHNLKYDLEVTRQSGIELKPIAADTMILSYLLHPGARQHGLDTLAVQELGHHPIPITDLIGTGKNQKKMSQVPLREIGRYAAEDADVSLRLYDKLSPKITTEGLTRVLEELELPLIPVLAHIEMAGVKIDKAQLVVLQKKTARRIKTLQTKIWQVVGGIKFNINSTQQLRDVLYTKLKLPTTDIKRTQSGFSTAASELEKLRGTHDVIELLEEYRELSKLQNTYIEPLPALTQNDGRIHGSFSQVVAATGRLSSSDPNLQNIPVRTTLGQEIRSAFMAERGFRLVKADYSQIDLRVAASISRDEKMMDAFRAGGDIHATTAAWINNVAPADVTSKQRRDAKTLNFGVLYGMGPLNFARASGVSSEEARSFIERYREQYIGLMNWIKQTIEQAESLGFVETLFGRRRWVPEINSNAPAIRAAAERAAFNFPIQGTAADILKKAMIELYTHMLKKYPDAKMILTVHDELVCEVPVKETVSLGADMKKIMESVFPLDVPLVVDVSSGSNWRDMSLLKTEDK